MSPIGFADHALRLAVTNPMDYSVLQDVEFRTGKKVLPVVVTETWLEALFQRLHPAPSRAASYDMLDKVTPTGEVEAPSGGSTTWSIRPRSPRTSSFRRS